VGVGMVFRVAVETMAVTLGSVTMILVVSVPC
jgi:hypothetical protein